MTEIANRFDDRLFSDTENKTLGVVANLTSREATAQPHGVPVRCPWRRNFLLDLFEKKRGPIETRHAAAVIGLEPNLVNRPGKLFESRNGKLSETTRVTKGIDDVVEALA